VYRDEEEDADASYTKHMIEGQSSCKINLIARDIGFENTCQEIIDSHMNAFGRLDILVNNAAEQHKVTKVEDLDCATVERTFRTNGKTRSCMKNRPWKAISCYYLVQYLASFS
jgi:NAD(P)-dependent dehydrogenase (short-subunit alcohol dehydrogenase family)